MRSGKERRGIINNLVQKSIEGADHTQDEIATLFKTHLFSRESALIQAAAREKSEKACASLAEVHAQIGLKMSFKIPVNTFEEMQWTFLLAAHRF